MGRRQILVGVVLVLVATVPRPVLLAAGAAEPQAPIPRSVWFYEVDATALPEVRFQLDRVLDHMTPANQDRLADAEVRIHVVPQDRDVTEIPLWSALRGLKLPDLNPADGYQETRSYDDVRGLGPAACVRGPLNVAIGEELVVWLPDGGRHPSPSPELVGWSLIHEIGHAVACSLSREQQAHLAESYSAARRRPLTEVVGRYPAYTVSDQREYFAEGTAAWFEAGPGDTYRREWLSTHDPELHRLMSEVFAVPSAVATCLDRRATTVLTPSDGPFHGTPGPDVVVGSSADDVVNGGGGDDVICGGVGNDVLVGGYGDDRLSGGEGDDTLVDRAGRDQLTGGEGDDGLDSRDAGETSPDVVDGSQDADTCHHDRDDQVLGCVPVLPATSSTLPPPASTTTASTAAPTTTTTEAAP